MPARSSYPLELLRRSVEVWWLVAKWMAPLLLAMRLLELAGWLGPIADALAPAMGLLGLPGEAASVLLTGVLLNLYAAAGLLASLLATVEMSVAQVSVVAAVILTAHVLPLEQAIVREAGLGLAYGWGLRLGGGLLYGWSLHLLCSATGWLQEPAPVPAWSASGGAEGWGDWTYGLALELALIFVVIVVLLGLMDGLRAVGFVDLLGKLTAPLLRPLGLSREAGAITTFGVCLGIVYGSGLILDEVRGGRLTRREVLGALTFLCLCHGLIEDSLIMIAVGADAIAVVAVRVGFSLALAAGLLALIDRMPQGWAERTLMTKAPSVA